MLSAVCSALNNAHNDEDDDHHNIDDDHHSDEDDDHHNDEDADQHIDDDDDYHNDIDGDMAMMMQMVKNMRILDLHCCDSVALIVVASNTNREISIDDQ